MNRIAFVGLIKIEFPGHTVRLCDGGFMEFDGETYRSTDSVFGALGGIEGLSEGVGEEVPVFELTLLPPGTTPAEDLSQPGYQTARARFWIGEYDVDAGTLNATPDLQFEGQLDQTTLNFGRGERTLALSIVSTTARLLERNIGNSLNPSWHKSIWPGETGHDNATGLGRNVAWGVEAPPTIYSGGSGPMPGFSAADKMGYSNVGGW